MEIVLGRNKLGAGIHGNLLLMVSLNFLHLSSISSFCITFTQATELMSSSCLEKMNYLLHKDNSIWESFPR